MEVYNICKDVHPLNKVVLLMAIIIMIVIINF